MILLAINLIIVFLVYVLCVWLVLKPVGDRKESVLVLYSIRMVDVSEMSPEVHSKLGDPLYPPKKFHYTPSIN
jgi:hypothetical protein